MFGILATASPAMANLAAPYTTQSHYIYGVDDNSMLALGKTDGTNMGSRSGYFQFILAFGQPEGHGSLSPGYGGYGTNTFASGAPFVSFNQIKRAVFEYTQNLYIYSGLNARMDVVVGTSNQNECIYHTTVCSPSGFGANFGPLLRDISSAQSYYSNQISFSAGSDVETGYDSASRSIPLIDNYNLHTSGNTFTDFGDAASSSAWTDAQIYHVAYGAQYDVTTAQAYNTGQDGRWALVDKEYGIIFDGVLTDGPYAGHDIPATAYANFQNALNARGVGQSSLPYLTHI